MSAASVSHLISARLREDCLRSADDWMDLVALARSPLARHLSLSAYAEKQLVFALKACCRESDAAAQDAAAQALGASVDLLGFRPKLDLIAPAVQDAEACLDAHSALLSAILQAYALSSLASPPRRAMDVCLACTVDPLLRLRAHRPEDADRLLRASLFHDVKASLPKCLRARAALAAKPGARAAAAAAAVADSAPHSLLVLVARVAQSRALPAASLGALCVLMHDAHPSLACAFWFEALEAARESDELVLLALLERAHLWYSPTDATDVAAFAAWTARLLQRPAASAKHLALLLGRVLTLDPRAVDIVQALGAAAALRSFDVVAVTLRACAEARSVPKWVAWVAAAPQLDALARAVGDDVDESDEGGDKAVLALAAHFALVPAQQLGDVFAAVRAGLAHAMVELALQALCLGCRATRANAVELAGWLASVKVALDFGPPRSASRLRTLHALAALARLTAAPPEASFEDVVVAACAEHSSASGDADAAALALARCAAHADSTEAQRWAMDALTRWALAGNERALAVVASAPFALLQNASPALARALWRAALAGAGSARALLGRAWFYESPALRRAGARELRAAMARIDSADQACLVAAQLPLGFVGPRAARKLVDASAAAAAASVRARAILVAALARADASLVARAFPRVVDVAEAACACGAAVGAALVTHYLAHRLGDDGDGGEAAAVDLVDALMSAKQARLVALAVGALGRQGSADACARFADAAEARLRGDDGDDDELLVAASVLRARHALGDGSVKAPAARLLERAAGSFRSEGARAFVEAVAAAHRALKPALASGAFAVLAGACVALNGGLREPAALQALAANARGPQLGALLDALLRSAREGGERARWGVAGLACVSGSVRAGGSSAGELARRTGAVLQCFARAGDEAGALALLGNASCKDVDAAAVVAVAMASGQAAQGAAVLRTLWERHTAAALAVVGALCSCARSLQTRAVQTADAAACGELRSLAVAMRGEQGVMRHHVVGLLAHHVTLCFFAKVAEPVRRPTQLYGFHLLDLCGEDELQQLHALLGGGVGGARRDAFALMVKEWRAKHKYEGAT